MQEHWLTRRQVAARLGKSVATVRRIEGVLLAPTRDHRGVHRFIAGDVDNLAAAVARGEVHLSREVWNSYDAEADGSDWRQWPRSSGRESTPDDAGNEIARLQREKRALERRVQELEAEIHEAAKVLMALAR
jgi:hypothetical protein